MTPKEKAKELTEKFEDLEPVENYESSFIDKPMSKRCALIAVYEIIENIKEWDFTNDNSEHHFWFWHKVKAEINKL